MDQVSIIEEPWGVLTLFELLAILLTVTSAFAWFNHRVLHLPESIGLLVMGLCASMLLLGAEFMFPNTSLYGDIAGTIRGIDFYDTVMYGMLAFLLFAGALHVDLNRLRSRAVIIVILASVGVIISTVVVGFGLWLATAAVGIPLGLHWALVFGALIAPTDPVAVMSTLKSIKIPQSLEIDMPGEALFNDGVAIVLFTVLLQAAMGASTEDGAAFLELARLIVVEAGGGVLIGLITGLIAFRALRTIDNYSIAAMISIALVMSTYAIANALDMSGPIAVVVAGLLFGNHGAVYAMSNVTRRYVFSFWTLVDNILNAILFLLIGLEVLVLSFAPSLVWVGIVAIPLVTFGRFVSVALPVTVLKRWMSFARGTIPVLTWGGVRGGICIALALSLPMAAPKPMILAATYGVVLFTIVVQGLTLGWVVRRTAVEQDHAAPERAAAE